MATSSNTWKFIWLIHQEQDVPERKKEFYVLTQGMWGTTGYRTKNGIRKTPTGWSDPQKLDSKLGNF